MTGRSRGYPPPPTGLRHATRPRPACGASRPRPAASESGQPTGGVVMPQVLGQHPTQVQLIDDQQPVREFPAQGADDPLCIPSRWPRRALVVAAADSRVSTRIPPRRSAVRRVHPDQHVRQLVVLVDGPGSAAVLSGRPAGCGLAARRPARRRDSRWGAGRWRRRAWRSRRRSGAGRPRAGWSRAGSACGRRG